MVRRGGVARTSHPKFSVTSDIHTISHSCFARWVSRGAPPALVRAEAGGSTVSIHASVIAEAGSQVLVNGVLALKAFPGHYLLSRCIGQSQSCGRAFFQKDKKHNATLCLEGKRMGGNG